jgi:acetolactate synthase small subunit
MIQKYTIIAEGEGRLDIMSRISMLFLQRHIDVESMSYAPLEGVKSRYQVCALAKDEVIRKVVAQMEHIEGLETIRYE